MGLSEQKLYEATGKTRLGGLIGQIFCTIGNSGRCDTLPVALIGGEPAFCRPERTEPQACVGASARDFYPPDH